MTEETKTNITEIKREPRNKDVLALLDYLIQEAENNEDTTELLAFIKINGDYNRVSTGINDMLRLIGVLETAKYDCITRTVND